MGRHAQRSCRSRSGIKKETTVTDSAAVAPTEAQAGRRRRRRADRGRRRRRRRRRQRPLTRAAAVAVLPRSRSSARRPKTLRPDSESEDEPLQCPRGSTLRHRALTPWRRSSTTRSRRAVTCVLQARAPLSSACPCRDRPSCARCSFLDTFATGASRA
jgi:hypothetical protein